MATPIRGAGSVAHTQHPGFLARLQRQKFTRNVIGDNTTSNLEALMSIEAAKLDRANLQHRVDRLRADLAATEDRIRKIDIYIEMAQQYRGLAADVNPAPSERTAVQLKSHSAPQPRGYAERVSTEVINYLRGTRQPAKTADLLDFLAGVGLPIGGEKPRNNLSGILSRTPELAADRVKGWHLVEWSQNATNADVQHRPQPAPDVKPTSSTASPQLFEQSQPDVAA